jgi:hypothetical protein
MDNIAKSNFSFYPSNIVDISKKEKKLISSRLFVKRTQNKSWWYLL